MTKVAPFPYDPSVVTTFIFVTWTTLLPSSPAPRQADSAPTTMWKTNPTEIKTSHS